MHFEIGPYTYSVQVTPGTLYDDLGREAEGLVHGDRGLIEIAGNLAPGHRPRVLYHELGHGYERHFPPPAPGTEQWCDWFATVVDSIVSQIMRQGGPSALMSLEYDTFTEFRPDAFTRTLADCTEDRMLACAVCQQRIAPGGVLLTPQAAHPSNAAPIVGLAFFCPHCEHVQHWTEFVNAAGRPTGVCALEPEYFGGEDAARFCRCFPEKTAMHPAS